MQATEGYTKTVSDDVIELNGKRYDALTGALLGKSHAKPVPAPTKGRVIDGFIRPSHPAAKHGSQPHAVKKPEKKPEAVAAKKPAHQAAPVVHHEVKHDVKPAPVVPKPATPHVRHAQAHTPKIISPHQPEHAKTLMRRAVHKPEAHLKPAIKPQAPAEMMAKLDSSMVRHKHSVTTVDPTRQERAERTGRHAAVHRFHHGSHAGVSATAALHGGTVQHVPVIAVTPAPQPKAHVSRPSTHVARPAHTDIFEAAISHATSHEHAHPKKHRSHRRLVNTLAVVGAFLVIGGFITFLSMPAIELRVASMQAGFHVSRPSYVPTGYALEKGVERDGGTVSMSFRSGDSRFTITQQASNWNSQTLLDNTLALSGRHETVQKNGQTIYVYGNGANAAWVNSGIRYDVTGNAQLSKDEIATIATSL
jgi:hypothetical protein